MTLGLGINFHFGLGWAALAGVGAGIATWAPFGIRKGNLNSNIPDNDQQTKLKAAIEKFFEKEKATNTAKALVAKARSKAKTLPKKPATDTASIFRAMGWGVKSQNRHVFGSPLHRFW